MKVCKPEGSVAMCCMCAVVLGAVGAIAAGCANSHRDASKRQPSSVPGKGIAVAPLRRPLYLRCGTGTFTAPQATPVAFDHGKPTSWQLSYLYPAKAPPPRSHQITNVTIIERATGTRGGVAGGREIVVAGQTVSYRRVAASGSQIAQWQTRDARYTVLANGTRHALERIIACLP